MGVVVSDEEDFVGFTAFLSVDVDAVGVAVDVDDDFFDCSLSAMPVEVDGSGWDDF